jgi:vancomycin resistance protein YoaR
LVVQEVLVSVEHSSPLEPASGRAKQEPYRTSAAPGAADWPTERERPDRTRTRRRSPRARAPRSRARWLWTALTALLLLTVLVVSAGLYAFDRSFAGKIYPNVSIRGVAVGELTPDAARAALQERFGPFLAQPITLTYGERTWTPTLAELGVRLEIDEAVEAAYRAGRGNGILADAQQVYAVYRNGLELPLSLTVDQAAMQAFLLGPVAELEQPAVDARIELDGTFISTAPAAAGQQVLVSDTLHEITAAMQELSPQTVVVRTRELTPRLGDAAVREAQAQIDAILAGPLTISVPGASEPFVWPLDDLARLVRVQRQPAAAGDTISVAIDAEQVRAKVQALADATERKGKHPRVDWNGGSLQIFKDGTPGYRVDEPRAEELVLGALAAPAAAREVELPVREVPSAVTAANLGQLGITDLLSVGRSDFSGSAPYRVTNIGAGMRLLHGVLVGPGEEFSFNNTIGEINAANGFVEGYAIIKNRTQLEWGGGICQDSTTVFRAAFWAGLPITERWGHSFYISWYDKYAFANYGDGPGMDATIFTGALDFKFLNDTGNWLLVQTAVDNRKNVAEVRIYGTDDGRKVTLANREITDRIPAPTAPVYVAEPSRPRGSIRQSDKARGGMTIAFTRVVERGGQVVEQRTFETKFKPWPNIFEVNPADLGPNGRPNLPPAQPTADPAAVPTPDPAAPPPADGSIQPAPAPADGSIQPAPPPADGGQPAPAPAPEQPQPTG